jgi:hypothetical protein
MNTTYTYSITIRTRGESYTHEVSGTEAAYAAYRAACDFIDALGATDESYVDLWWTETGEVVESYPEWEEPDEADFDEDDLEIGFDPYEGGYTWDC